MISDPWVKLRQHTTARVALGRAGGSLPTAAVLGFAADHAEARDAVYSPLDVGSLQTAIRSIALESVVLKSQATDRDVYLQRPDLGRRLDSASVEALRLTAVPNGVDIALVIGDGLSAMAAQQHAAELLRPLIPLLQQRGFSLSAVSIVEQARVAIQDEIGSILRARLALILIGERPGLGSADSLGAYLVFAPAIGKTDADRNCVSNIRPQQLHPKAAAETLAWLTEQSLVRQLSGVQLKDDRDRRLIAVTPIAKIE